MNGALIRLARDLRNFSQAKLSRSTGIPTATLCRLERNERRGTSDELTKIASVLDVPNAFFDSAAMYSGAVGSAHFRRKSTTSATIRRRVVAWLNLASYVASEIRDRLGVTEPCVPMLASSMTENASSPERGAYCLRSYWQLPPGPIRNLVESVEAAGIAVFEVDLGDDVMGVSQWTLDRCPVVLLNSSMPGDRQRFTLAHEVSHLYLHTRERNPDTMEDEANLTAAELLMPREDIEEQLITLTQRKLTSLKPEWGVAMSSLIKRASDLGYLTPDQARRWFKMFAKRGWRTREPGPLPRERVSMVPSLGASMIDAWGSLESAAESLAIDAEDFRTLVCAGADPRPHLRLFAGT